MADEATRRTVVVVEDDAPSRNALGRLLRAGGFEPALFESAEAFLKSDRFSNTDCVITDVQMPGTTGIELQGRLIADGHRVPVIFITAFPEMRARAQALAAGAIGFLAKPFNDQNLITCLNEALTR